MESFGSKSLACGSGDTLRSLAGLYRSTFVCRMQERFRLMLAGAYDVYAMALGGRYDPALRSHLSDVLHQITACSAELIDVFAEDLMNSFRVMAEQSGDAGTNYSSIESSRGHFDCKFSCVLDDKDEIDADIHEFVAKTIKSYETRYGSIILAVARTYTKLTGCSVEGFRPSWTPAKLFSAFSIVLQHVGIPIDAQVKLALYKMFSQEVLRHLGDGCMDFRYVLPHSLSELNSIHSEGAIMVLPIPTLLEMPAVTLHQDFSEIGTETMDSGSKSERRWAKSSEDNNAVETVMVSWNIAQAKSELCNSVVFRFAVLLVGVFIGSVWILEQYLSGKLPNAGMTYGMTQLAEDFKSVNKAEEFQSATGGKAQRERGFQGTAAFDGELGQRTIGVSDSRVVNFDASGIDRYSRHRASRTVRLQAVNWHNDAVKNKTLFAFTVINHNRSAVGAIEVTCSRYSDGLEFLEAAKTVLAEPIEAGQSKSFRLIQFGFANQMADRVSCFVSDFKVL